jgi:hypothetical protein
MKTAWIVMLSLLVPVVAHADDDEDDPEPRGFVAGGLEVLSHGWVAPVFALEAGRVLGDHAEVTVDYGWIPTIAHMARVGFRGLHRSGKAAPYVYGSAGAILFTEESATGLCWSTGVGMEVRAATPGLFLDLRIGAAGPGTSEDDVLFDAAVMVGKSL